MTWAQHDSSHFVLCAMQFFESTWHEISWLHWSEQVVFSAFPCLINYFFINQICQICHPNWVRLASNGSQNVLKLILKSPRFLPFGDNLPKFVYQIWPPWLNLITEDVKMIQFNSHLPGLWRDLINKHTHNWRPCRWSRNWPATGHSGPGHFPHWPQWPQWRHRQVCQIGIKKCQNW